MAGILLGGLLTQYVGWRAIFLVNPPIVVVLSVLSLRLLPGDTRGSRSRLDVAGAVLVTASVAALIYGLSEGQQQGFTTRPAVGGLLLAVLAAAGFVGVERRVALPMLPFGLFADRARRAALAAVLVMGGVLAGYVYFMTLYLQTAKHYSAVRAGVALAPAAVTTMVVSMFVARRLLARLGTKRTLALGLASMALGQLWLSRITAGGGYVDGVLGGLLLTAFGVGTAFPTASVAVTAGVDVHQEGVAGSLLVAAQQIGIAAGLAVLVAVAAARTRASLGAAVAGYRMSFLIAAVLAAIAAVNVVIQLRSRRLTQPSVAARRGRRDE
jgi:MFS family permease